MSALVVSVQRMLICGSRDKARKTVGWRHLTLSVVVAGQNNKKRHNSTSGDAKPRAWQPRHKTIIGLHSQ